MTRLSAHLEGIDHLVWDWNGTLLDDAWLCVSVMNGLLESRGLPLLDLERYQEAFVFPVRDYYVHLGFDFEAESFEVVGTEFIEGYEARQSTCELQPEARTLLSQLEGAQISQSILSASQRSRLHRQARALEIDHHFTELAGLDDHFAGGKVELGRAWLEGAGIAPERTLLVGDTDHDAEVARALGFSCVLVPSGHQSRARLETFGVPVLGSLAELLD